MAKMILGAALALVLTACGGGSGASPFGGVSSCDRPAVTVALLGDSTQFGLDGHSPGDGKRAVHNPGAALQAEMDAEFGVGAVRVTDYGVSGTAAPQAPKVVADVIVANFGINDMREPGQTVDNYVATMKALGATLIETQSPIAIEAWPLDYQARYVDAAKGLGLPVADVNAYVLSLPDWQSMLGPIQTHPDDDLYVLIVHNVLAPAVAKQVAPLRCSAA